MNQQTIESLIEKYKHIGGSKDFIILAYVSLSNKYKQARIKQFIKGVLNQEHFNEYILITNESLENMIIHWEKVYIKKRSNSENHLRELFTYKALKLMLSL